MVFLVRGRDAENIEKKNKAERKKKHWKKKKYRESKITAINIFSFTFYYKL